MQVTIDTIRFRLQFHNVNQDKLPHDNIKKEWQALQNILDKVTTEQTDELLVIDANKLEQNLKKDNSSAESFLIKERSTTNIPQTIGQFTIRYNNNYLLVTLKSHQLALFYLFLAKYFPAFDYIRESHYGRIYQVRTLIFPTFLNPIMTVYEMDFELNDELQQRLQGCVEEEELTRYTISSYSKKLISPSIATIKQMIVGRIIEMLYECEDDNSDLIQDLMEKYDLRKVEIQLD